MRMIDIEVHERFERKKLEEYYIKAHGRVILGYCACCGAIHELDDSIVHTDECIWRWEK